MILRAEDFEGRWRIARDVDDRRAGQVGRFDGWATFTDHSERGGVLLYEETGTLHFGSAAPMAANRRYIWKISDLDVEVLFEDARPFHRFTLGAQARGTDHPCGEDLYRVTYDFSRWPLWQARWEVAGPRKDYTMTSRYERDR